MAFFAELLMKWAQHFFSPKSRKAIQDWDFIMVFKDTTITSLKNLFQGIKCQEHVKFQFIEDKDLKQNFVLIKMDDHIVIEQAHQLKMLKIKNKKSFEILLKKNIYEEINKAKNSNSHHYADYLCFIAARNLPGNEKIKQQQRYSVFNKNKIAMYPTTKGALFNPEEELRCKYNFILTYRQRIQNTAGMDKYRFPFIDLMKNQYFQEIVSIHKNSNYPTIILESVKDYVGSNDEVYFEFVGFLQKWLVFPAIVGLFTFLFNYFFEYSADDSPGDFIYSLLTMIWSIYFITSWQNESRWLKTKQQSGYNDEVWSEHQNIIDKKHLMPQISPVTELIGSCFLFSLISILWMILSLNARGFVDPKHKLLYFETLSNWAASEGIFDAQTWWGQIPNLIHVIVTNVFDENVYRPLAKKLTKIERHLNSKSYSNSIIMKFFIYEFIITFADFFYIAFVRFDIEGLREQLLSLFFIDVIRRLVAETLLPRLKNKYLSYRMKQQNTSKIVTSENKLKHQAILEVSKQNFQSFDDYLEIITNFGYLVLISSCFPLAPLLIIFAHSIQILQDKYKLIHIYRRRLPQKFVGMGTWKSIIVFICYFSIVTNIMLFAFSSQQIVSIFPQMFDSGKDLVLGNTQFATLVGGVATGLLLSMLDIGNNAIDLLTSSTISNSTESNLLSINFTNSSNWVNYLSQNTQMDIPQSTLLIKSYKPVPKEHEMEFVAILFLIEHVFLIGFILFRTFLSKRKSTTDIFLERRAYKRKVKKYLSQGILADNMRDQVVDKIIAQTFINQNQNPLDFLTQLVETTTDSSLSQSNSQNDFRQSLKKTTYFETEDPFVFLVSKLGQSAQKVFTQRNFLPNKESSFNFELKSEAKESSDSKAD